jgi:hypothetical protein
MPLQRLTLTLEGITAGDYLAWVRDPEPPALGLGLCSITVRGEPLGDTVEALLSWSASPPDGMAAGPVAGLPLTPEVIAVRSQTAARPVLPTPATRELAGAGRH